MLRTHWLLVLLPSTIFGATLENHVSSQCLADTKEFLSDLHFQTPKSYAVKMYDAMGKLGSGVMYGNIEWLGSRSECLAADSGNFQGQYCKLQVQQDKARYSIGICVPNSCHTQDITALANSGVFTLNNISLLPSLFTISRTVISVNSTVCPEKLFPIDTFISICLFFSVLLVLLPITGTVYVAVTEWRIRRAVIPSDSTPSSLNSSLNHYGSLSLSRNEDSDKKGETGYTAEAHFSINLKEDYQRQTCSVDGTLKTFSLQQNLPAVLSMERAPGMASAVDGIRVLSLLSIICGHTSQMTSIFLIDNYLEWKTLLKNPLYLVFGIGPSFLSVDSFFFISGLLSTRSVLSIKKNSEERLTLLVVLKYTYNRIVRLQPLHLYIVCLSVGLYSLIPWGSTWEQPKHEFDNCRVSWWANILLVNNFINVESSCCPWTWYLADDFQFYMTTPLLVFIYIKSRHVLFILVGILFLVLFLLSGMLSYFLRLPIRYHGLEHPSSLPYLNEYYMRPYCRYGPFLLGIVLGIVMFQREEQLIQSKKQAILGWVCSLCSMLLVIALAFMLDDSSGSYSIAAAIYQSIHRTLWAATIGWTIIACEQGYGGIINKILSWDIWNFLSKISYAAYLVHPILITIYIGVQETTSHFSGMNMFYLFSGFSIMTFITGLALTVLIGRPFQKSLQF